MDWITGTLTLVSMYLVARKHWQGWLVGLINQGCWLALILERDLWGLLPLTIGLVAVYSRALYVWRHPELLRWKSYGYTIRANARKEKEAKL